MRVVETTATELEWAAPDAVRAVVASLGRAEDVRFSPSNRRLAITGFLSRQLAIFDIQIECSSAGVEVRLTGAAVMSSPELRLPHGLDFIDDETIAVANRHQGIAIFKVPAGSPEAPCHVVTPIGTLPAAESTLLRVPGSVAVSTQGQMRDLLICNNTGGSVTRHHVAADFTIDPGEVMFSKWLIEPDGVAVSPDCRWLAISDHNGHCVPVHAFPPSSADAAPDGFLRGVFYPHGVRFSPDSQYAFVADAGAPFVYIYAQDGSGWQGVRYPIGRIRIMDEQLFAQGHSNPTEGGPKGIDVDASGRVLAVASEYRSLAFFDLPRLMNQSGADAADSLLREPAAVDMGPELHIIQNRRKEREAAVVAAERFALLKYVVGSASWRITEPLRRLHSLLRRT